MTIDSNSSEVISLPEAKAYTHTFQENNPNEIKAYFAGINKINLILEQKGCIGIRIYNGQDPETGKSNLVLVGVNEAGEDMELGPILEDLVKCPPTCAGASALLSV